MRLTNEQIEKYRQIYFATFGVRVSKEEATLQGMALARLVKVLSQQAKTKENEDEYTPRNNNRWTYWYFRDHY